MAHHRVIEWNKQYNPSIGNPSLEDEDNSIYDDDEAMSSYYQDLLKYVD